MPECSHQYRILTQSPAGQRHPHWGEIAPPGASAADLRRLQPVVMRITCWNCGLDLTPGEQVATDEEDEVY